MRKKYFVFTNFTSLLIFFWLFLSILSSLWLSLSNNNLGASIPSLYLFFVSNSLSFLVSIKTLSISRSFFKNKEKRFDFSKKKLLKSWGLASYFSNLLSFPFDTFVFLQSLLNFIFFSTPNGEIYDIFNAINLASTSLPPFFWLIYSLISDFSFLSSLSIFIIDFLYSKKSENKNITDSRFFDKWFTPIKRETLLTISLRKWLNYFWYSFFAVFLLELFGLSISSLSSSEDIFLTFENFFKNRVGFQAPQYDENNLPKTWSDFDDFQRTGFIITFLPEFFLPSYYLVSVMTLLFFNLPSLLNLIWKKLFLKKLFQKELFLPFSFDSADNWLRKMGEFNKEFGKEKVKREFIQKEILSCKRWIKAFDALKWTFTVVAAVGTILAIKFSQGGSVIGVTSIIGTQLADKGKERSESVKNELQKLNKELNQEFINDVFQEQKDASLEKPLISFLDQIIKLSKEKNLFLNIPINDEEEISTDNIENESDLEIQVEEEKDEISESEKVFERLKESKKRQGKFIKSLQRSWNEEIEETINNLWEEVRDNFFLSEKSVITT